MQYDQLKFSVAIKIKYIKKEKNTFLLKTN